MDKETIHFEGIDPHYGGEPTAKSQNGMDA